MKRSGGTFLPKNEQIFNSLICCGNAKPQLQRDNTPTLQATIDDRITAINVSRQARLLADHQICSVQPC
jgi:hypothetical protein